MGFETCSSQIVCGDKKNEPQGIGKRDLLRKTELNKITREKGAFYRRARAEFEACYNASIEPDKRIQPIIERIDSFLQYIDSEALPEEVVREIKIKLQACGNINDKDQFLNAIMLTLQPIFNLRETHKKKFEDAQAHSMNEMGGFSEINRVLSYGKTGPVIHFHAPAGETVAHKTALYRDGMRRLAEIVNTDPDVKVIMAISSLVAEHERLFSRAGFTLEKVSEEFKKEHFPGEDRDVKKAWISREDFLKRFLKEDSE